MGKRIFRVRISYLLFSICFCAIYSSSAFSVGNVKVDENPVILQSFYWYIGDPGSPYEEAESNLWKYIAEEKAEEFKNDGFSHVWLPPVGKAFSPSSEYNPGYAVYDHYDLGEFNQMGRVRTKYGTKEELHAAVGALHDRGIKVIADIVMNHMLGTDNFEVVDYSSGYRVIKDSFNMFKDKSAYFLGSGTVNAYVNFDFKNSADKGPRGTKYSDFVWRKEHFDGIEDYNHYYLFSGKETDKVAYFGDLLTYPASGSEAYKSIRSDIILGADIDFQHQKVREEMIRWTKWLVDEVGFDGFRVDALRHIHTPFIKEWSNAISSHMKSIGKYEDMLMFGESWDGWSERLNAYLLGTPENNDLFYDEGQGPYDYCGIERSMSLFDVPLHYDFRKIAKLNHQYPKTHMIDLPNRGLLSLNPNHAITFVDNHDTVPTQELASYIPVHTKLQAYTFILLNQHGIPTVFYRDMYKGNFVSNYESDSYNYLHFGIKSLLQIRKKYAYGPGRYFTDSSKPTILGYKRSGDSKHPGSGAIYLIREFDSEQNGMRIPMDGRKWVLKAGNGNIADGVFYLNGYHDWAVWVPEEK